MEDDLTQRERYIQDERFQKLINALLNFIKEKEFSPEEILDASKMTSIIYHKQQESEFHPLYKDSISWWLDSGVINE
jgi:hypothetical protein